MRSLVALCPPAFLFTSDAVHCMQSRGSCINDDSLQDMVAVKKGTVLFIPASTDLQLHSIECEQGCSLLAYAATANDRMFQGCEDKSLPVSSTANTSGPTATTQVPHAIVADE